MRSCSTDSLEGPCPPAPRRMMRFARRLPCALGLALCASTAAHAARAAEPTDLLTNGGFEDNGGVGTIPTGWQALDENAEYYGWVAPRAEQRIGEFGPRTGRFLAGLDTDRMGVDTNGMDYATPRCALHQTVRLPAGFRGEFSVFYNDSGSFGLAYVSVVRLAFTIDSTDIAAIRSVHLTQGRPGEAGVWSQAFHRVEQGLPNTYTALGDWTRAAIPVVVPPGQGDKQVTLWIGVFDYQNSTELGYWRLDDAALVAATTPTAPTTQAADARPGDASAALRSVGSATLQTGVSLAPSAAPTARRGSDDNAAAWPWRWLSPTGHVGTIFSRRLFALPSIGPADDPHEPARSLPHRFDWSRATPTLR